MVSKPKSESKEKTEMSSLQGQVAVIRGANSGIGAVIADNVVDMGNCRSG